MKTTIAAITVLGALTLGALPAAAQAQWDSQEIQGGGRQFALANEDGDSILLLCQVNGQGAGFLFAEPIESLRRVTVRGVPGGRENVAVSAVNDRLLQVAGGSGLDFTFDLLRESTRMEVRAGSRRVSFEIFGSNSIVSECLNQEEDRIGQPRRLR